MGDQRLTWENRNTISLDRRRALKIFNLAETATPSDIRKAYRRLSLIHHPDKGGQSNVFNTIHAAYEILTTN